MHVRKGRDAPSSLFYKVTEEEMELFGSANLVCQFLIALTYRTRHYLLMMDA